MDIRMKNKMKNGQLTRQDVCSIIDWQLSLEETGVDCKLLDECLLFLYSDQQLTQEERESLFARLCTAAFGAPRVRRHKAQHRRRYSLRMLAIALLMLLLTGAAVAAVWGIFGRFTSDPMIEMSHQRLEHLEEVALKVGETMIVTAPAGTLSDIDLTTDYGKIAAQQYGRQFELTVDQVYCDGNKLYYSYQLREDSRTFELFEGMPTGFESWDWEEPGLALADTYWTPGATPQEMEQAQAWFAAHPQAYAIESFFGLGDGADLNDGSEKGISLNIYDSGQQNLDAHTIQGFQQVDLPEDYVPGETIDFLLTVMYSTQIVAQDETGVYRTGVHQKENRGFVRVPVTARITGESQEISVTAEFEEYTAEAQLAISDVDISGMVYIDAPPEWIEAFEDPTVMANEVYTYELIADGQRMPNVSGGYGIDRDTGRWQVYIRYDLPESTQSLTLVPKRIGSGEVSEESIVIR